MAPLGRNAFRDAAKIKNVPEAIMTAILGRQANPPSSFAARP